MLGGAVVDVAEVVVQLVKYVTCVEKERDGTVA